MRINMGKDMAAAYRQEQETKLQRMAEERKREKDEMEAARAKLKVKMEEDRCAVRCICVCICSHWCRGQPWPFAYSVQVWLKVWPNTAVLCACCTEHCTVHV